MTKNTKRCVQWGLTLIGLLLLLSACSGDSGSDPDVTDGTVETTIPATGGTLEWTDSNDQVIAALTVPDGALDSDTTLIAKSTTASADGIKFLDGTIFEFGPDGLAFDVPAELVVAYDPAVLGATQESALSLYRISNGVLSELASTVDTVAHTVTAEVPGFSTIGVGAEANPPVTTATPAGGNYDSLALPTVTLNCADEGGSGCSATYYTLDGSDPTTSSPVYSGPLEISDSSSLKFFSTDIAGNGERVQSESYTIIPVFTIGGTVSVSGAAFTDWLWLDLNGVAQWSMAGSGSFVFPTAHTSGYDYTVTVKTSPPGKSCEVTSGTGTVASANVTDIVVVCQDSAVNAAPVANAGMDQSVTTGSVVTLDGTGSSGADPLTYTWTLSSPAGSAATLDDATSATPSFTADEAGTYTASLVVDDGTASSNPDTVMVTATAANTAATLSTLAISPGTFDQGAFDPAVLSYTATVGFDTSSTTVTAVPADSGAEVIVGLVALQPGETSVPVALDVGLNAIDVSVTAEDGVTSITYQLSITRQPDSAGLVSGQVAIGPVANGTVEIYDTADLSSPIFAGITANDSDLDLAGLINFDSTGLSDQSIYLVVVTGGEALDYDRDGVHDGMATSLSGKVHALIPGSQLKAGGWYVSEVTEGAYRSARYLLESTYDNATVLDSLDKSAKGLLLDDLNGDLSVDHLDLALWRPFYDSDRTQMPGVTRRIILEELRTGTPLRDLAQTASGLIGTLANGHVGRVKVVGDLAYVLQDDGCQLDIIDISDPGVPTQLAGAWNFGACSYLSDLEVVGNTVYAVGTGFHVIDVSDPTSPVVNGSHYTMPGTTEDISSFFLTIDGTVAYIGPYTSWSTGRGGALMSVDISDPANPYVMSTFYPATSNNQALDLVVSGNYAYFLVSTSSDDHPIVDITDPAAMTSAGTLSVGSSGEPNSIARSGNYLYVAEPYRVSVTDISSPAAPVTVSEFAPPYAVTFGQSQSGGILAVGSTLYVGGNERIYCFDIAAPSAPTPLGHVPAPSAGGAPNGFDVAGGLAVVGNSYSGIQIIDVTDPAVRGIIGSVPITAGAAARVEARGGIAYVTGGTGLEVVDFGDPTAPYLAGTVPAADLLTGQPHLALAPTADVLFYGAWSSYAGGLNVIDVGDPANPVVVTQHDEYPQVSGLAVGEYLYLSYRPIAYYPATALPVFQSLSYAVPTALTAAGSLQSSRVSRGLAVGPGGVDTEMLYFYWNTCSSPPDYTSQLLGHEVDAQGNFPPASGQLPTFDFPGSECVGDVAVSGDVALATTRGDLGNHLFALDVSDPTTITELDRVDAYSNEEKQLKAVDGSAYVAARNGGLLIVDIGPDGGLTPSALVKTPGDATDVAISGDFAAIADGDALRIVRLPVRDVP